MRYTWTSAIWILLLGILSCNPQQDFSIIIMSDLHYDSTGIKSTIIDSVISHVNILEESNLPEIPPIQFVGVLGDLTDTGSEEEWKQFKDAFGIVGEKKIRYPVYETFGNHDGNIDGPVRSGIAQRNRARKDLLAISENGLHISWNVENYHFVSLGNYPGNEWDPNCEWCNFFKESFRDPQESLKFLEYDLANNLLDNNQPVVLFFHYGWDDFSLLWWTKEEQDSFFKVIKDYNIKAIFHGHNHGTEHYLWHDINVWASGSPQRGSRTGNLLLASFIGDSITVKVIEVDSLK